MSNASGNVITRVYSGFRGVDFRGEEISLERSPDSLNMWKDYKETESIRTRPGMELSVPFPAAVYGIFFYKDYTIVHSGKNLYSVTAGGKKTILWSGMNEAVSDSFVYEEVLYIKDGKNYLRYDGVTLKEVEGYVPTTSIGRKPAGGGSAHEDVNMLSDYRINTFLADGKSTAFSLDAVGIDTDFVPAVTVNGTAVSNFTVDYANGKITFASAPGAPLTDGQDNVTVKYKKAVPGYRDLILKCTLLQVFDNRVFVSGNEEDPNTIRHCGLNDPTYFSDLDYYREGMDSARVKGLVAGNNALWVFREPSDANTNVFYHTPIIDEDYGKIYPSSHSSVTTGCVGRAINFGDDIVFFSERGMEGISGDITTEQVVAHRSTLADRKLTSEPEYRNMILAEWEGYLMVFIGDRCYLADSRTAFTNENHIEYEWFCWQMEQAVTCAKVHDGVLHLGTADGLYTLTDNDCEVESWWTTPLDKFRYPQYQKTTSKKSCTVEAVGDEIQVYAKTNRDVDWGLLGTYEAVTDAFSCRVKKKKFKDIKLKFYSTKRFSLESATLSCFVGGYLKNL